MLLVSRDWIHDWLHVWGDAQRLVKVPSQALAVHIHEQPQAENVCPALFARS